MLATQSPNSGNQIHHPKTVRKPLQLKNSPATPINNTNLIKSNRKPRQWIEIIDVAEHDSNKENIPPNFVTPGKTESRKVEEAFDASLADELNAIREKLQRMRLDKEKTEKILSDRATMLDVQVKELLIRGEEQKQMEIEVDRLFRLKELKLSCMRILPIRSLREKVVKSKKMEEEDQSQSQQSQEMSSSIGIEQSNSKDMKACESECRSESSGDVEEELS